MTTAGGTSAANPTDLFTYVGPASPPAPTVTGMSPTSGPTSGGTVVTISGSNLSGGRVAFGATSATSETCGATSCTATSPAGAGSVLVTVSTAGGTSNAGVFAYRAPVMVTLSISTTGSGTVTGASPGSYVVGTVLTLTANPASGHRFVSWKVDGSAGGTANPYTLTMDRNHTVVATFSPVPPAAAVSPTLLAFGSQRAGTTSSPRIVTLTNTGTVPLVITKVALGGSNPGQFARSSACPGTLAAGASCQISVTFSPTSRGDKSASLTITDNAPTSPQRVTLEGRGS